MEKDCQMEKKKTYMKCINTLIPPPLTIAPHNLLIIQLCRLEHPVSVFAIRLYFALRNQDPHYRDLELTAKQTVGL